ncbi:MAG TPA: hypothetical protein PLT65_05330 [Bacilli bacterium]|nr:hypothetical protein [Bacilli bacterium]
MLNQKGFAFTTIVYAIVLMLGLSMFLVFSILRNDVSNSKNFGNEIDKELEDCLNEFTC